MALKSCPDGAVPSRCREVKHRSDRCSTSASHRRTEATESAGGQFPGSALLRVCSSKSRNTRLVRKSGIAEAQPTYRQFSGTPHSLLSLVEPASPDRDVYSLPP